jgi:hypothetical protein
MEENRWRLEVLRESSASVMKVSISPAVQLDNTLGVVLRMNTLLNGIRFVEYTVGGSQLAGVASKSRS